MADCYCGSSQPYNDCCQPYHQGYRQASTAEALMRSRYSAFVIKQEAYLLATWYSTKRPIALKLADDTTDWVRLDIIRCHKGRDNQSQGTVEFKAYYRQDSQPFVLHEISQFRKDNGIWFYVDGATKVSLVAE